MSISRVGNSPKKRNRDRFHPAFSMVFAIDFHQEFSVGRCARPARHLWPRAASAEARTLSNCCASTPYAPIEVSGVPNGFVLVENHAQGLIDLRHACVNVGTHVPAIRPTRPGRAIRRRALACEVGGAPWDARPTRELPPRCVGASVAGVVLCLRIGCLSSAALQVQHARRRLFLLPSRGAASTAIGEETRSRTRAGAVRRTCGWFSPPHSSRMSRTVVLLFFFCRRSSSLSRAFSLVVASCGASPRQRASRRATRARCARRACVTGGSRRRSRARMSRVWCSLLLSSLVLSLRARRSLDSPARRRGGGITSGRAAHATRDATRTARGESERRAPSKLAVCVSRAVWSLGSASAVRLRHFARASPSLRRAPGACAPRAGARCT